MPTPVFALSDLWPGLQHAGVLALFLALFPIGTFSNARPVRASRWRVAGTAFAFGLLAILPADMVKAGYQRGAEATGSPHPVLIGYGAGALVLASCLLLIFVLARRLRGRLP